VNNLIFSSTAAASGAWRNISNLTALSVQLAGLDSAPVWVEASNDPNVETDGAKIAAPASAPVLSLFIYSPGNAGTSINWSTSPPTTAPLYPLSNPGSYTAIVTYLTDAGETTGSAASGAFVLTAGQSLQVASPAQDPAGLAFGYNVYLSQNGGPYCLQNYAANASGIWEGQFQGPVPMGEPFLLYAFQSNGIAVPGTNTTGSPASGINVSGVFTAGAWTAPSGEFGESQVIYNSGATGATGAMFNPSCLVWNYLRVVKGATGSALTTAWLFGQNG